MAHPKMHESLLYLSVFFMVFLSCAVMCFCMRVLIWIYLEYWGPTRNSRQRPAQRQRQRRPQQNDGQGIFTISDSSRLSDDRIADFFYLEPNSQEAARIRAQLEKDDKDLPSYDEVMRMANLMTPTAGIAASSSNNSLANIPAPPYTEADPNPLTVAAIPAETSTLPSYTASTNNNGTAPSTSRAAATTTSTSSSNTVVIPISMSNNDSSV